MLVGLILYLTICKLGFVKTEEAKVLGSINETKSVSRKAESSVG